MAEWTCVLTSKRLDGSFTFRRIDASEPKGVVPAELVPEGAQLGVHVVIEASVEMGDVIVHSCELATDAEEKSEEIDRGIGPVYSVGNVVWANVLNPLENENATGKKRPVVLVSGTERDWRVMGLTTQSTYASGQPRVPIPDWGRVGLQKEGFLWGYHLTRITRESVISFIGLADDSLVEAIIKLAGHDIDAFDADALRAASSAHGTHFSIIPSSLSQWSDPENSASIATLPNAHVLIAYIDQENFALGKRVHDHFQIRDPAIFAFVDAVTNLSPEVLWRRNISSVETLGHYLPPARATAIAELAATSDVLTDTLSRRRPLWLHQRRAYEIGGWILECAEAISTQCEIEIGSSVTLISTIYPHAVPSCSPHNFTDIEGAQQFIFSWRDTMQSEALRRRLTDIRDSWFPPSTPLLQVAQVLAHLKDLNR